MQSVPKSLRLQIGLFGRVNTGKSSFLNCLAGQDVAITSDVPGTTTDVVEKVMELLPIGPVVFLDTAGLNDDTDLGKQRSQKTKKVFDRANIVVLITEANLWTSFEEEIISEAEKRNIPCIVFMNKVDVETPVPEFTEKVKSLRVGYMEGSALDIDHRDELITNFKSLVKKAVEKQQGKEITLIGDLLPPKGLAILIVPIDYEAPKGRIILPQVQTIRDLLDHDQTAVVVKESEYVDMLNRLKSPPDLVVCDSQVVDFMVDNTPKDVKCTTFSILLSRQKGKLNKQLEAASAIKNLKAGDKILIAEACSHHPMEDDIGRQKIPRWLKEYVGGEVQWDVVSGRDWPENLEEYKVVIHCGACMITTNEVQQRIKKASDLGIPVSNYGLTISQLRSDLERVLEPFPEALEAFNGAQ